jgi:hypothetical protein
MKNKQMKQSRKKSNMKKNKTHKKKQQNNKQQQNKEKHNRCFFFLSPSCTLKLIKQTECSCSNKGLAPKVTLC